uniref:Odorant receptor 35 n=1 Tax=Streltzoviella insularis TaxID=1206366 RepID=A0A7D5UMT5_9NEOP|nr:odorant receptor 35 [Streltzoviella insularis]
MSGFGNAQPDLIFIHYQIVEKIKVGRSRATTASFVPEFDHITDYIVDRDLKRGVGRKRIKPPYFYIFMAINYSNFWAYKSIPTDSLKLIAIVIQLYALVTARFDYLLQTAYSVRRTESVVWLDHI